MRIAIQNLPDDIETLKRLVIEREAQLEQARGANDAARNALERAQAEGLYLRTWIEKLKLEIARLRRMQFGRSSEKLSERIEQLELIVEDLETSQAQTVPVKAIAANKVQPVRKPLPKDLPRKSLVDDVTPEETSCPECGADKKRIGEEVSEQLEYVPARFTVHPSTCGPS